MIRALVFTFLTVSGSFASAEYMGIFTAPGQTDIAVYKESGKLIVRPQDGSMTSVYKIITHIPGDAYLFGDNGIRSNIDGTVMEVLGQSTAYDGLLKTTYVARSPVSNVFYFLKAYCEP